MVGILAFARAELEMLGGGLHTPPVEGLVPGRVRMPPGGWQAPVLCPGVYSVCCAFVVGQQSVRGLLCFAVGDEYVRGGDGVVEVCGCQGVCDLYFRAFPTVPVVFYYEVYHP